jgi:hypothetical protein
MIADERRLLELLADSPKCASEALLLAARLLSRGDHPLPQSELQ